MNDALKIKGTRICLQDVYACFLINHMIIGINRQKIYWKYKSGITHRANILERHDRSIDWWADHTISRWPKNDK